MPLWTLRELELVLGLAPTGENIAITSIHTDSRDVQPGGLFIALPGDTCHGAAFLPQAMENGAVAALLPGKVGYALPQLVVSDTMQAFWRLAEAARTRFSGKVIGVTGSAGKTTTTRFLTAALQAHAPEGSFNNHVGVPLTLMRMPADAPFAVIEMGMNHPGEIAPLTLLARPDVALITNVKPVHTEAFQGIEGIRAEKLTIVQGLSEKGALVVPTDVYVSPDEWAGHVVSFDPEKPLPMPIIEPSPARVACAQAALAVLDVLDMQTPEALSRLADVPTFEGRGAVHQLGGVTLIDDSYNANPASLGAALQGLLQREGGRKFALIGDMLELGAGEVEAHLSLVELASQLDGVWAVGDLMAHLYNKLPSSVQQKWVPHADDLSLESVCASLQEGDVLLVKGSKKMLYVHGVVDKLKVALHDKTVL